VLVYYRREPFEPGNLRTSSDGKEDVRLVAVLLVRGDVESLKAWEMSEGGREPEAGGDFRRERRLADTVELEGLEMWEVGIDEVGQRRVSFDDVRVESKFDGLDCDKGCSRER
jgi:hypothetical protein